MPDRFLRGLARGIAGALAEVGLRRRQPEWVGEVLAARDRRLAPRTAPAGGLYLVEGIYGKKRHENMKQKTWTARKEDLSGDWYVVDATGVALGRLAASVARLLRGKHKPTFTPHLNSGDHVVVVNAEKVLFTGGKLDGKVYTRYTGYPSGLRTRTLRQQQELDPTFPIYNAVRGMLQRNTLGAEQLKRLRVYTGPDHKHAAQQPKAARFDEKGDLQLG